jgi:hypothetical protein
MNIANEVGKYMFLLLLTQITVKFCLRMLYLFCLDTVSEYRISPLNVSGTETSIILNFVP